MCNNGADFKNLGLASLGLKQNFTVLRFKRGRGAMDLYVGPRNPKDGGELANGISFLRGLVMVTARCVPSCLLGVERCVKQ